MKIIAKIYYYEEDEYFLPCGISRKKVKKDDVIKSELIHRKNDFKCTDVGVKTYCCEQMEKEHNSSLNEIIPPAENSSSPEKIDATLQIPAILKISWVSSPGRVISLEMPSQNSLILTLYHFLKMPGSS